MRLYDNKIKAEYIFGGLTYEPGDGFCLRMAKVMKDGEVEYSKGFISARYTTLEELKKKLANLEEVK